MDLVYGTLLEDIKIILNEVKKLENAAISPQDIKTIEEICASSEMTPEIAQKACFIFQNNKDIANTLQQRGDYLGLTNGVSGLTFFLPKLKSYLEGDSILSYDDMIRVRSLTTGVKDVFFIWDKKAFIMYDVGGQRCERKKWIHCFDDVDTVVYLVASNEFDMKIQEADANSMEESLTTFKSVTSLPHFNTNVPFIVLFNKVDLLEEKLKRVAFSESFPEYCDNSENKNTVPSVLKFLEGLFIKESSGRKCFFHSTCAIDTKACCNVWSTLATQACLRELSYVGL
eukprot:TRINITY_DN7126_c0_g1_i10.p1 TRINITY_DN7126_c0_g1~~TRINITY_DN7126_c0_g1_i10.p1  ORF type:complete len:285 (+),score=69.10 TRINITY_DN7126_c0_g1_i10:591-1445(+)